MHPVFNCLCDQGRGPVHGIVRVIGIGRHEGGGRIQRPVTVADILGDCVLLLGGLDSIAHHEAQLPALWEGQQ